MMRDRTASLALAVLCAGACAIALAQQSAPPAPASSPSPSPSPAPAREMPRPDQLEPAVTTAPAPPESPAAAAPASSGGDAASAGAASKKAAAGAAKATAKKGPERLELETTDITGNRELPKVLYIVPWKRSDLGDVVGKPVNSLLDEVLQPLDRDVFQRENRYYDALKPDEGGAKAEGAPGAQSKP